MVSDRPQETDLWMEYGTGQMTMGRCRLGQTGNGP
jgi:hypothetical protein